MESSVDMDLTYVMEQENELASILFCDSINKLKTSFRLISNHYTEKLKGLLTLFSKNHDDIDLISLRNRIDCNKYHNLQDWFFYFNSSPSAVHNYQKIDNMWVYILSITRYIVCRSCLEVELNLEVCVSYCGCLFYQKQLVFVLVDLVIFFVVCEVLSLNRMIVVVFNILLSFLLFFSLIETCLWNYVVPFK